MCSDTFSIISQPPATNLSDASFEDVGVSSWYRPHAEVQETVILEATVLTMARGKFNVVEAVAFRGDTIVAVGTLREVQAAIDDHNARLVSYGSKVIMPGFIDPHLHLLMTALMSNETHTVDLSYPRVKTKEDALSIIKQAASRASPQTGGVRWISGFGYDPSLTLSHPDLTRHMIDTVSGTDCAVIIVNQSGHVGYLNTAVFSALGIGLRPGELGYPAADTNFQKAGKGGGKGGEEEGSLTGLVFESVVHDIGTHVPQRTTAELVDDARQVLRRWASRGVTTAFDCGIGPINGMSDLDILRRVLRTDDSGSPVLPRYYGAMSFQAVKPLLPISEYLRPPPWRLTNGSDRNDAVYGIKFWLDGSTQGFTAAIYQPYNGQPNNHGILNFRKGDDLDAPPDDDGLLSYVQTFMDAGWQIIMHTNGGRAVDQALRVYARALAAQQRPASITGSGEPRRRRHMHRLEHVTAEITPAQLARAAQLGLGVSHLIAHVRRWGNAFAQWVLDEERASRLDPVADDIHAGLVYSFHSDSPISETNPLQYVETAATRVLEATGGVLGADQCITVEEAFAGITFNPARQLGRVDEIGTLEPGKKADFVVLSKDPRTANPRSLASSVQIVETWVGGALVHELLSDS